MRRSRVVPVPQEREPGDVSLKLIVTVVVAEALIAVSGVFLGDYSWQAAVGVLLAGVAGYVKTDRIRPTTGGVR